MPCYLWLICEAPWVICRASRAQHFNFPAIKVMWHCHSILWHPNSLVLSCKDVTSPHRRGLCSCISLLCSLLWIVSITDFHFPIMLESIIFQRRKSFTFSAELVEVYARLLPVEQVSHSVAEAFLDSLHLHLIKPSKPLHGTLAGCHLHSQRSPPLDVTMAGWYLTDVVAFLLIACCFFRYLESSSLGRDAAMLDSSWTYAHTSRCHPWDFFIRIEEVMPASLVPRYCLI